MALTQLPKRAGAAVARSSFLPPAKGWPLPSPGSAPIPTPETHRSLTVAPLIADQRCYGEAPARRRRGPRGGPVQSWRNSLSQLPSRRQPGQSHHVCYCRMNL